MLSYGNGAFAMELAVKATVLLLTGWALTLLLRRSSSALRHQVWSVVLAGLVALPLLTTILPSWAVEVPTQDDQVASGDAEMLAQSPVDAGIGVGLPKGNETAPDLFVVLWMFGMGGVGLWLVVGVVGARRLRQEGRKLDAQRYTALAEQAAGRAGLRRPGRIAVHDRLATPVVVGWMRPLVVLPRAVEEWSDERLEDVLVHEYAHVRRADNWLHLLGRLACALFWFHPLVWFATYRLRIEREHAADDVVVTTGSDSAEYAEHLLAIAASGRNARQLMATPLVRQSSVGKRISAVLDAERSRRAVSLGGRYASALMTALLLLPLACATTKEPRQVGPANADLEGKDPVATFDADGATIDLLAAEVPSSVERRAAFPMSIYWRVRTPFPENPRAEERWRVFVHFDGPLPLAPFAGDDEGMRFQADHSVSAPGEWWTSREVFEDRFAVIAGHEQFPRGEYAVYVGWFKGRPGQWTNARITRSQPGHGDPAGNHRFAVGTITLR